MGGGEAGEGMDPFGGQFHHGAQEKFALGQVCMRHLQVGGVDDHIIHSHNINIHQTVDVIALAVAV